MSSGTFAAVKARQAVNMLRISSNFYLSIFAAILVAAAIMISTDGTFGQWFGGKSFEAGDKLFEFDPHEITEMDLRMREGEGIFEQKENGVWWGKAPWIDRMDPRAAAAILQFSIGTEIIDVLPKDDLDFEEVGLEDDAVRIRLNRNDGSRAAKYRIGNRSPWVWDNPESETKEQTVYASSEYYDRTNEAYVLTGNIKPLFDPQFRRLRDHRPFLFHRSQPYQIRLNQGDTEILMERESSASPWKILKPIQLKTSATRLQFLVEGLEKLTAVQVNDRNALTLPEGDRQSISIKRFGEDYFTTLEVIDPIAEDSKYALATVSDRPNAIFHLPLKPIENLIGFSELPLKINELRNRYLVDIDRFNLRSITIQGNDTDQILISRNKGQPYRFRTQDSKLLPISEDQLKNLIVVLGFSTVESFVSDAATDLTQYNLDNPLLKIGIFNFDSESPQTLHIARGDDSRYYATLVGSQRVVEVSENLFSRIATKLYQWRNKQIFDFPSMDITRMTLTDANNPEQTLTLEFDYLSDTWRAKRGGIDVTADLNPAAASKLFEAVASAYASNWLPPNHRPSTEALRSPSFAIQIERKVVDQFGDEVGREKSLMRLAPPIGSSTPAFYYGTLTAQNTNFSLSMQTIRQIAQLYRAVLEE